MTEEKNNQIKNSVSEGMFAGITKTSTSSSAQIVPEQIPADQPKVPPLNEQTHQDLFGENKLSMGQKIGIIVVFLLITAGLVIGGFVLYQKISAKNQITSNRNTSNLNTVIIDRDHDGLTDQEEMIYGTNPTDPDTDHDGYTDGDEVKNGYNPNGPGKL